jgi:signal transduction histidine kinase
MTLLPNSLAGRTVALVLLALALSHLASMYLYHVNLSIQLGASRERIIAERVATSRRALEGVAPAEREKAAHGLATSDVELHWSGVNLVGDAGQTDPRLSTLKAHLRALAPELADTDMHLAFGDEGVRAADADPLDHILLLSARLDDGSWANFRFVTLGSAADGPHFIMPTLLTTLAVLAASMILIRQMTAPLRDLARGARRLGTDMAAPPIPSKGPREIRDTIAAFNEMQQRLRKLLADRTLMLAAVSHDLRTPITAIKLRAEFIEDADTRDRILANLEEMEAMVGSALVFAKDGTDTEEPRIVDVAALLDTLCTDLADAGKAVTYRGTGSTALRCRHLALKRAFRNLIDNALTHGGSADVGFARTAAAIEVTIDDGGPGIPAAEREKAFAPFERLDGSRPRQGGGFGLGLAVARSIIRAHGGDVTLADRVPRGLRVIVTLPAQTTDRRAAAETI